MVTLKRDSKAAGFLGVRKDEEDERLLRLFWNRAELKREFAKLRRERDRVVDHLRQQEGATLRAQQRLDQLEGLLADPLRAANAAVFYQLRGVWQYGRRRLSRLARDLGAQQQELEHRRELARFEDNRQVALTAIDKRLLGLEERQQTLEAQLQRLSERRLSLSAFWRYLERRSVEMEEEATRAALEEVSEQRERYVRARHEKLSENVGAPDTLSVDSRRIVNTAVIALAQELLLHFVQDNVAELARDAALRHVTDITYGGLAECRALSQRVESVLRQFEELDDLPTKVRQRSVYLAQISTYARPNDAVPVAGCFDSIVLKPDHALRALGPEHLPALSVNVVADDYWDIYSVLLS